MVKESKAGEEAEISLKRTLDLYCMLLCKLPEDRLRRKTDANQELIKILQAMLGKKSHDTVTQLRNTAYNQGKTANARQAREIKSQQLYHN